MLKRLALFLSLFIVYTASSGFVAWNSDRLHARTEKRHFREQNIKKRAQGKGSKRFMVTQKATEAQITRHPDPEKSDVLLITLLNVDPYVTYYKVEPNRNFGVLSLKQFMWYCHMGKSLFSKENPRGAMGYLSFDDNEMHFNVFQLNEPIYDKKTNQLTYQISNIPGFSLDDVGFRNVILTIDLSMN